MSCQASETSVDEKLKSVVCVGKFQIRSQILNTENIYILEAASSWSLVLLVFKPAVLNISKEDLSISSETRNALR